MDNTNDVLAAIGLSAALIPSLGSVIKNTIDNFRGPFNLDGKQCVTMCYCLSMFLVFIFLGMTLKEFSVLSIETYFLQSIVTGWLTANWAGMLTNGQTVAKQQQVAQVDSDPVVLNRSGEPIARHDI